MNQASFPFPPAFASRVNADLGDEAHAYWAAMECPACRGLRLNPRKPIARPVDAGQSIPWEPNGFLLELDSTVGAHPLHEAGAYYLQEPSAMIPARVLSPRPGERVLDLCAAPGGKSTQIADLLMGSGLLVCNEPIPSRAQVLSRNVERMGISNALVVSAEPERLAPLWPQLFQAVLVDAPCSGEGMFRRHPEARAQWDEQSPERCAARQLRILESAVAMLAPGGRLVYSTCTLNRTENEGVVQELLRIHPELSAQDFSLPGGGGALLQSQGGMLTVYPHKITGEGHFAALLIKQADTSGILPATLAPASTLLSAAEGNVTAAYADFAKGRDLPVPTAMLGNVLLHAPDLPPLRGVRVLRAGLHLGTLKGKVFAPDHALAMGLPMPYPLPCVDLSLADAAQYQNGQTLMVASSFSGYALATHAGLALGFVKCSDGQLKNHYPKGLRRP